MEGMSIGEVARLSGTGVEAIRFYEREGLLPQPQRSASGYRSYRAEDVARLRFIRQAKALGFSLREIGELLALRVAPGSRCADVKRRAEAKIADVEARIDSLTRIRQALVQLAAACTGRGPVTECPILEALEKEHAAHTPGRADL